MNRSSLIFIAVAALCGCTMPEPNVIATPFGQIGTGESLSTFGARRGQVEAHVKSNYDPILNEIAADGGVLLSEAMEKAGVPTANRPALITKLRGDLPLYRSSPSALVTILLSNGGAVN